MSNEELASKVEHVLQRKLTSEEYKFLSLANQILGNKADSPFALKAKAKVA